MLMAKAEIDVVSAANWPEMSIEVSTAPPEHTFDFEALVQAVLDAPGYNGA